MNLDDDYGDDSVKKRNKEFADWLRSQPSSVPIVLGARAVLRAFKNHLLATDRNDEQVLDTDGYDIFFQGKRTLLLWAVASVRHSQKTAFAADSILDLPIMAGRGPAIALPVICSKQKISKLASWLNASPGSWKMLDEDIQSLANGLQPSELMSTPLFIKNDKLHLNWVKRVAALGEDKEKFAFWIDWYERFLDGQPQNWDMLEEIALLPADDWDKGAAHINPMIAEIRKKYLRNATPLAERMEWNPETERLRIVPEPMSQKSLFNDVLETVRDGMNDLRENGRFSNAHSALAPVFDKILDRTFEKYISSPQRVHNDFLKAKRRIQRLIVDDELAADDEVTELVTDLDEGAAHIRANMPKVKANMAKLAALRISEASQEDIDAINRGAEQLAEHSEPEMAGELLEDAQEILTATREIPASGAPLVLDPNRTYRLANRLPEGNRILIAKKAFGDAVDGYSGASFVAAAIEVLRRLLGF